MSALSELLASTLEIFNLDDARIDEPLLRKVIDRALQLANIQNVNYSIELFEDHTANVFMPTPALARAAVQALRTHGQIPFVRLAGSTDTPRAMPRLAAVDCQMGPNGATCEDTQNCPFRHPPQIARIPCRHFVRSGGACWYQDLCSFLHMASAVWGPMTGKPRRHNKSSGQSSAQAGTEDGSPGTSDPEEEDAKNAAAAAAGAGGSISAGNNGSSAVSQIPQQQAPPSANAPPPVSAASVVAQGQANGVERQPSKGSRIPIAAAVGMPPASAAPRLPAVNSLAITPPSHRRDSGASLAESALPEGLEALAIGDSFAAAAAVPPTTVQLATCFRCRAVPSTVALVPCGHHCLCDGCVFTDVPACPVCGARPTSHLRIHFPA